METQETNKLIAEFMGDKVLYSQLDHCTDMAFPFDDLHFHESWDWLMPVVEQIESLGYCYDRIDADVFINKQSSLGGGSIIPNPMDHNTMTMLEKTYCVVVQFIEYYNNTNK
mgnify:CR=1 FL=1